MKILAPSTRVHCGKLLFFVVLLLGIPGRLSAQAEATATKHPITVSLFTESVSLPDFHSFFKKPNWGIRLGTEFYYSQNASRLWLQTINIGYYHHRGWQQGIYLSSELGYRQFVGRFYADATIGAGYLHLLPKQARYRPSGDGFARASAHLHRFMPVLGLGLGYDLGTLTLFTRYEAFGEMPFNYGGSPVLPHRALHLGTRFRTF